MYLNTNTLERATERDIRAAFPNTSFPEPFVAPAPYAVLFAAPQPTYDPITQSVRETTPELTTLGHWEQRWEVVDLDAETIAANTAAKAAADRQAAKAARAIAVANIKVTTAAGNEFDGDEVAQGRMARAVVVMSALGPTATVNWVLADNTVIQATAAELTEALALAGAAQAALWVI